MDSHFSFNLHAWQAEVTPPPRFQAEVWQRIAARASTRRGFLEGWFERLVLLLPRPHCAATLVAASIALGLCLGYVAGGNARSVASQEGRALYLASISPLNHTQSPLE
ncbi:MAG: hypothetical protein NTZ46_00930 [Verrucomicrobia bacterium]|nr:hypothetical protein [Verrucomicrobiota bacterium]